MKLRGVDGGFFRPNFGGSDVSDLVAGNWYRLRTRGVEGPVSVSGRGFSGDLQPGDLVYAREARYVAGGPIDVLGTPTPTTTTFAITGYYDSAGTDVDADLLAIGIGVGTVLTVGTQTATVSGVAGTGVITVGAITAPSSGDDVTWDVDTLESCDILEVANILSWELTLDRPEIDVTTLDDSDSVTRYGRNAWTGTVNGVMANEDYDEGYSVLRSVDFASVAPASGVAEDTVTEADLTDHPMIGVLDRGESGTLLMVYVEGLARGGTGMSAGGAERQEWSANIRPAGGDYNLPVTVYRVPAIDAPNQIRDGATAWAPA